MHGYRPRAMNPTPLVSVGIPTYDRPETLERAIRSVLAQDERDLEVVVADDASPNPGTAAVCERLAAQDGRVRVLRNEVNLGHAGNYQHVLEAARGEFFMWLADDDWIDPAYVSRCLAELRRPGVAIACGTGRYYRDGAHAVDERPIDLLDPRPGARVVRLFANISVNGPLFGLMRRSELLPIGFPQVVGGDWLLVAKMAERGRVRTLPGVFIHRSITGIGADAETLARSFGLDGVWARHHHLWVARELTRRLRVPPAARLLAAALVVARFTGADLARRAGLGALESVIADRLRR
jgi:glycosyltransferase involved in cell wall biosynthesis